MISNYSWLFGISLTSFPVKMLESLIMIDIDGERLERRTIINAFFGKKNRALILQTA